MVRQAVFDSTWPMMEAIFVAGSDRVKVVMVQLLQILDRHRFNNVSKIPWHTFCRARNNASATDTNTLAVDVRVCGRTDAGVHAVGQVARVRTKADITAHELYQALQDLCSHQTNTTAASLVPFVAFPEKWQQNTTPFLIPSWRCLRVERVSDKFHPTFGAKSRSYLYLIDIHQEQKRRVLFYTATNHPGSPGTTSYKQDERVNRPYLDHDLAHQLVHRLNALLRPLEGKELDYYGVSHGKLQTKSFACRLERARAHVIMTKQLSTEDEDHKDKDSSGGALDRGNADRVAIAIALTANRFLRRMVRILVATALQLSFDDQNAVERTAADAVNNRVVTWSGAKGGEDDSLLKLIQSRDRQLSANAAPPDGLIFMGAEFYPASTE